MKWAFDLNVPSSCPPAERVLPKSHLPKQTVEYQNQSQPNPGRRPPGLRVLSPAGLGKLDIFNVKQTFILNHDLININIITVRKGDSVQLKLVTTLRCLALPFLEINERGQWLL